MGIYIKDMEMPTRCGHCRFADAFDCGVTGGFIDDHASRPSWCPLVEVPAHGRLIDVDAMERLMSDIVQGDIRGYPYSDTLWDTTFRWLDSQPTIIPAEEDNNG